LFEQAPGGLDDSDFSELEIKNNTGANKANNTLEITKMN
jgi:hypothetical protein